MLNIKKILLPVDIPIASLAVPDHGNTVDSGEMSSSEARAA